MKAIRSLWECASHRRARRQVAWSRHWLILLAAWVAASLPSANAAESQAPSGYAAVRALFAKHCLDCHAAQEPEGKLVLEDFASLSRGGESGPAIVPTHGSDSLLVKMIEGNLERRGKKIVMPPGKREKLTQAEIALIREWIDAGAVGPGPGSEQAPQLVAPRIMPKVPPRHPIRALASMAGSPWIAAARDSEVQLISSDSRMVVRTLTGHRGSVNALALSQDGASLFAAGGEAGMAGEVRQWKTADGTLLRSFPGAKDALYAVALSPDGKILAAGGYDQKVRLWHVASGAEFKILSGHNGSVFGLAFRPDGKILASASADRTVKLWEVSTGERRDTLAQPLKDVNTLAFSPDGKRLLAAGADNRIRVWEITEQALETTNPLLEALFAHEGAVLKIAFSNDGKSLVSSASDQTVRVWDYANLKERLLLEPQPDWAPAVAFSGDDAVLAVGRLDGTIQFYDATSGQVKPPPKPELARIEPRGLRQGTTSKVKLIGSHLAGLTEVKFANPLLKGTVIADSSGNGSEAWMSVSAPPGVPRGSFELSVLSPSGESGKVKLHIDDLPQVYLERQQPGTLSTNLDELPASVWATHQRAGDVDELTFRVPAGRSLVFDLAAKRLGSKADAVLTLMDAQGKVLESSNGFDGDSDPLMVYRFPQAGEYKLRISELVLGASPDHYYRLSIGSFPFVTGCFPLSVRQGQESEVELTGYNLPSGSKVSVRPEKTGELELPLAPERYRARRGFKLLVSDMTEMVEAEPNNTPATATSLPVPGAVGGRMWSSDTAPDTDYFRFEAKAGQNWMIETSAAERGSPVDTRIEVLHADGSPIERVLLQAVRDSSVTFRGIDSDSTDCRVVNWEEMQLNQFLFLQGEVLKLFRAPQGPDSGFVFYSLGGKRRCFFDTSPTAHAVDAPCYIVEPRPVGSKIVANGLPVFPVFYENDDDGDRRRGTDSKIQFTAPADGAYLVRVKDTRGFVGDRFVYRLVVRSMAPDFKVALNGNNLSIPSGSGQSFSVSAERTDGFEGAISVTIDHLPKGYLVSTPLVIQAGMNEAKGTLFAGPEAAESSEAAWKQVEVKASASVDGRTVVKDVTNFGMVKLAGKPKLFVSLQPDPGTSLPATSSTNQVSTPANPGTQLPEITIAPGQTVPALLRVLRNGHDDLVTFTVENLPHGVIVDNIGLNGVLIPKDQSERQVFLTAAKWVPETDRICFAIESQAGRQTSLPILLHVRRPAPFQAAAR